jgi:argininosuccinate lyase
LLAQGSRESVGREIRIGEGALEAILSPERFVAVRTTYGGPAPEVVTAALEAARNRLTADGAALQACRTALKAAGERLAAALQSL